MSDDGRPTLMLVTRGITEPNLSAEPLATEAEATPGPSDVNPYRSVRERELVEQIEQREREKRDGSLFKTIRGTDDVNTRPLFDLPRLSNDDVDLLGVENISPFNDLGPEW